MTSPANSLPPAAGEAAHTKDGFVTPLRTHIRLHLKDSVVVDAANQLVAEYSGPNHEDKAAQLVRACNAYDSDQRKIKALTEELDNAEAIVSAAIGYGEYLPRDFVIRAKEVKQQARAALALAKEGKTS